jgi:prepilin-type N-terminal cleavage/methylation domain-containing protein
MTTSQSDRTTSRRPGPGRPRRRRESRGFTLIELLAVLAILGLLMSVAVLGLGKFKDRGYMAQTQATMQQVENSITLYTTKFGAPPPDTLAELQPPVRGDSVNENCEALYCALHSKTFAEGASFDEKYLCNTDGDSTSTQYHRDGVAFLFEFKDGWDNPIAYFVPRHYGKQFTVRMSNLPKDATETDQVVTAQKSEKTGVWAKPDSYQLISAGPDRVFGTADDVTNFK